MRKLIVLSAPIIMVGLSQAVVAQDSDPPPPGVTEPAMTEEDVASWPPELQAQYQTWPDDHKAYFWTLPPNRQDIFWRIQPEDRTRLIALTAEGQEVIWTGMEAKVAAEGQPDPVPADQPMTSPDADDPDETDASTEPMAEPLHEDDLAEPRR